jgi:hypothetical protein
MKISELISNCLKYVSEAVARIFGPDDDAYPNVGVQPFDGDPYDMKDA